MSACGRVLKSEAAVRYAEILADSEKPAPRPRARGCQRAECARSRLPSGVATAAVTMLVHLGPAVDGIGEGLRNRADGTTFYLEATYAETATRL